MENFNSTSGMATKQWGPKLWDSLFIMILGTYPPKIIFKNKKHLKIKNTFKYTLLGLKYTLPCAFCRESFKKFIKQIPIQNYLDSRINLMYWLYQIKDLVNKKLIKQEKEYIIKINNDMKSGKISKSEYDISKKKCFKTIPSPPFIEVLQKYENYRAQCNKILKKCVI